MSERYRRRRAARDATPPEHLDFEFTSAREEAEVEEAVRLYVQRRGEEAAVSPIGTRAAAEFERQRTHALLTRTPRAKALPVEVSERPYLLDRDTDGRPMHGPYGELLVRALVKGLRSLQPYVVALHPGLFVDVLGSFSSGITGNTWMAGAFTLPTNVGAIRVVMAEMLAERTGMVVGLNGSRAIGLSEQP